MLLSAVLDTEPEARLGLDAECERSGVAVVGRRTALGAGLATEEVLVMIPAKASGDITRGDARRAAAESDIGRWQRDGMEA